MDVDIMLMKTKRETVVSLCLAVANDVESFVAECFRTLQLRSTELLLKGESAKTLGCYRSFLTSENES